MVMGGYLPFAAMSVLLQSRHRPRLGVFTENQGVLQLREIAHVAAYSQIEVGKLAVDLLNDVALGRTAGAATHYAPFEILSPSNAPPAIEKRGQE
jgi:hypothetical protein